MTEKIETNEPITIGPFTQRALETQEGFRFCIVYSINPKTHHHTLTADHPNPNHPLIIPTTCVSLSYHHTPGNLPSLFRIEETTSPDQEPAQFDPNFWIQVPDPNSNVVYKLAYSQHQQQTHLAHIKKFSYHVSENGAIRFSNPKAPIIPLDQLLQQHSIPSTFDYSAYFTWHQSLPTAEEILETPLTTFSPKVA